MDLKENDKTNEDCSRQACLPVLYEDREPKIFNLKIGKSTKLWKLEKGTKLKIGEVESIVEEDHFYPEPCYQTGIRIYCLDRVSGVYDFFHFYYGHIYIGESENIKKRIKQHFPNIEMSDPEEWEVGKDSLVSKIIKKFNIQSLNTFLERCILIYFPFDSKSERKEFEKIMILRYNPIFNTRMW